MGRALLHAQERCKLAAWVLQAQALPPALLAPRAAGLLRGLVACLRLDNAWKRCGRDREGTRRWHSLAVHQ